MNTIDYQYRINADVGSLPIIDTSSFFDSDYLEHESSAIDTFAQKAKELNKIQSYFSQQNKRIEFPQIIGNLIVLGYVSAVESYLREIFRKLIIVDKTSTDSCLQHSISYGAAILYKEKKYLPEAILENVSFASKKNITNALKNILGVKEHKNELNETLDAFEIVCQLRHCLVHRYGKLGAKNAINLGLNQHRECLEKPITLNFNSLQTIVTACNAFVYDLNNYLFSKILARTIDNKTIDWTWDLRKDRKKFAEFYNIFHAQDVSTSCDSTLSEAYSEFRKAYINAKKRNKK